MNLTVNDIAAALQLIDITAARGAFRGEELSQVGALRDRFAAFVKAAQDAAEAEAAKDAPADAAETIDVSTEA